MHSYNEQTPMERRTLLLTSWYLPRQVLTWQDAITMVCKGKVDVVAEYDEVLRSPSLTMKCPAVLRLRRVTSRHKKGVKFSRENVYGRDDYRCQYCGDKFPVRALSYDHVVPRASGGQTTWDNIVTACKSCNAVKGNRSCDAVGMWPLRAPARPKRLRLRGEIIDAESAPEEWQAFLQALPQ